ncbi:VOC family protein [Oceanisphaera pacifica]|uniref:VOC family protein n=1 Tax=Oceanisphaera pacifica TaxID=2818389 RepID=A0ABS3NGK3_9GAMM|nr:VOC family protein [Oceanisphaera pacifica]MBO1519655.1 VOC family protein [Oceanisphaera pacifica]
MKANPIVWFEIYVADMTRARTFYEAVLQITLEPTENRAEDWPDMWMFPGEETASGACGALVKMDGVSPGGGGTLVYFSCDDCAEQASRVQAHGGQVIREKFAIGPYGFIALAADTEGNMIGLHSMD